MTTSRPLASRDALAAARTRGGEKSTAKSASEGGRRAVSRARGVVDDRRRARGVDCGATAEGARTGRGMIDESGPEKSPSGRTHPPDVGANRRLDASLDARSCRSFVRSFVRSAACVPFVPRARSSRVRSSRATPADGARARHRLQAAAATGPRSPSRRARVARDERRGMKTTCRSR